MVRKIVCASIPEWILETYLSDTKNRSELIQKYIILGCQNEMGMPEFEKRTVLKAFNENKRLELENQILKMKLGKFEKRYSEEQIKLREEREKERRAKKQKAELRWKRQQQIWAEQDYKKEQKKIIREATKESKSIRSTNRMKDLI